MEDIFGKIPFDDGMVAIKVHVWMGENEEDEEETENEENIDDDERQQERDEKKIKQK